MDKDDRRAAWRRRPGIAPVDQGSDDRDLLGGGREDSFVAAAATLAGPGDHALALEIISPGLLRYPASAALQDLRRRVLRRLLARHQQDPFRFLIYAELAGIETGPTRWLDHIAHGHPSRHARLTINPESSRKTFRMVTGPRSVPLTCWVRGGSMGRSIRSTGGSRAWQRTFL
jgi:hypothetical protein